MKKNLKKILSAVLAVVMLLSLCAPVFPVSAADELTKVTQWNLVLGDEIAVNFHVSVSDEVSDAAVMQVTDGYGIHSYALSETEKNVPETIGMLYVRGNWGDSAGAITNIHLMTKVIDDTEPEEPTQPEGTEQVFAGGSFAAGADLTVDIANDQAITQVSFDYKVNGDGYFNVALLPDWSNYYGYFKLDANGEVGNYAGVDTEKLANGYIRVYIDMASVTQMAGTPSNVIIRLFVRGSWTTASGVIENIRLNQSAYRMPRGVLLAQGQGKNFELKSGGVVNSAELTTISFDYKIVGGEKFALALMPNWSSYFGYFNFTENGCGGYNGVTTEALDDGYIRVTFDLEKLTLVAGSPNKVITMLYFRGDYCNADVYVDNIQFS